MTEIAVHGAAGRMGRTIIEVVLDDGEASLAAAVEHTGHASIGTDAGVLVGRPDPLGVMVSDDLAGALAEADIVIDFSLPQGTRAMLERCLETKTGAVIGTTGLDDGAREALAALAKVAAVVYAPNFSVGVNVFWALARRAVELLGDDFDMEIVEMHHKHKVDAPSGTAVKLLEVVAEARGVDPKADAVPGRNGLVGARKPREVGVLALRGGDVVGDHTLVLAGPGERVELTHRAHSRSIFARGAVRAAQWAAGREPGLYSMADVLGIE
ncbi:MAG: 4-hydroxy-tetrahydrodipicolinate reductase [Myxococcales bacterium]|nr:4-hydroxy-tetrahydrodipicolinate reductase [Myxococcales bacterium]